MATKAPPPTSLPEILPIFPLTGVLLLPRTYLPLHIFEPRYRNMVEDALEAEGVFGMIQPVVPQQDNRPLPGSEKEAPELYNVGCAGHLDTWERLPGGRYVIKLRGLTRFRAEGELPLLRGYRRVKANYSVFPDSTIEPGWHCDRSALIQALEGYSRTHGLRLQSIQLAGVADLELVNLLGVSLPFHPTEKQALLEAPTLKDREGVLLDLLHLGAGPAPAGSDIPPRTIN